jgi:hypothetical protein
MRSLIVLAWLLILAPSQLSAQAGIAGDWELTFTTAQGSNSVVVNFVGEGEKITSTLLSPFGSVQLAGTETTDGDVRMTGVLDVQGLKVDLGLNAKLTGETLAGTIALGTLGDFPFTGKRAEKKEVVAAPPSAAASSDVPLASVSGKWDITLTIPNGGAFPFSASLLQEGDKVTGTVSSAFGEVPATGTFTNNSLQLEYTAQTPLGALSVSMVGEHGASGFVGKATVGGISGADWTGVRAPQ